MRYEQDTLALLHTAHAKAKELGHSYVGSIHLLLAMLVQRGGTGQLLRGFGMESAVVQDMAALLYGKGTADLPLPQGLTDRTGRVLQAAALEAKGLKIEEVNRANDWVGLVIKG